YRAAAGQSRCRSGLGGAGGAGACVNKIRRGGREPDYFLYGDMRLPDDVPIEIRTAGLSVPVASCQPQLFGCKGGDSDVVPQTAAFGDDISEGVEDHGASILELVVIHADSIGEDGIYGIVIGPGGQPFHQPLAAFEPVELDAERSRVRLARLP